MSENFVKHHLTRIPDPVRIKNRRLRDINRGVHYWKTIEEIADKQWHSRFPVIGDVQPSILTVPRPTPSDYPNGPVPSEYETVRSRPTHSEYLSNKEIHNSCSITNMTSHNLRNIPLYAPGKVSLSQAPTKRPNNEVSYGQHTFFNTWGSLFSPLDQKTHLTEKDKRPREEPPRFRDSVKHVLKPVPRKAVPMSRIGTKPSKQIKTLTNFRSRNGIVHIIKPLDPLPEIHKCGSVVAGDMNIEAIEKEKTFVLLGRIDCMLNRISVNKVNSMGSSEEAIQSSHNVTPITLTETSNSPGRFIFTDKSSIKEKRPIISKTTDLQTHKTREAVSSLRSHSLCAIDKNMTKNEVDVQVKCQRWIDRWVGDGILK